MKSKKYHFELCLLSVLRLTCFKEKGQAAYARVSSPAGKDKLPKSLYLTPLPRPLPAEEILVTVKIGIILKSCTVRISIERDKNLSELCLQGFISIMKTCLIKYTENFTTKK